MIVKPFEQEPNGDFINKLSNHLFDFVMPKLKPSEWMVLCFIIRKTTGWHKESDKASLADIVDGTGIESVTTVNKAIGKLEQHGYILVERGPNKRKKNIYTLNTTFELDVTMPENDTVEPIYNEGSQEAAEAPIPENDIVDEPTMPENDTVEPQTISKNDNYKITESKRQFKKTDSLPPVTETEKPPKPPREPTEKELASRAMFAALVALCQYDLDLLTKESRGAINQAEKGLREKGYTPADLEQFGIWWYANDWRGQKGQPPTLSQIRNTWGQFKNRDKARQNGYGNTATNKTNIAGLREKGSDNPIKKHTNIYTKETYWVDIRTKQRVPAPPGEEDG